MSDISWPTLIRQDLSDHEEHDEKRFEKLEASLSKILWAHLSTAGTIILLLLSIVGYVITHQENSLSIPQAEPAFHYSEHSP